MAGYSGKTVIDKLGIKNGMTLHIVNHPSNYFTELIDINFPVKVKDKLTGKLDFIHFFTTSKAELKKTFPKLVKHLSEKGMIWISWPKKASKVETDITENTLREVGLPLGVVDIKVIAVDETWSGLKFVFRKGPSKPSQREGFL